MVEQHPDDDAALDRLAVPLTNAEGAVAAWVLAMPFLRPGDLARADDGRYPSAVREAYAQLAAACAARRAPDQALVVMGHLHVQGAAVSEDSERRLVIGGEEALDAGIFPPEAAYVALGHLHRPQGLGGGHIRYCGSPLPLSFSEMDYPHQVVEVELDGAALAATRPLHTPRPVPLLRVPATHQPLEQVLEALDALQLEPAAEGLEPLLEVQVLASIAPTGMRARVEAALTGKPVRLTGIQRRRPERAPDAAAGATGATPRFDLSALRPEPLFERLLDDHPDLDNREGLRDALAELLDRVAQEA